MGIVLAVVLLKSGQRPSDAQARLFLTWTSYLDFLCALFRFSKNKAMEVEHTSQLHKPHSTYHRDSFVPS